jgi:hypothetical protein
MKQKNINGGIGLTGILLTIFIVLKLTKLIEWSWLWVLSPIWISIAFLFLVGVIIGVIYQLKSH